MERRVLGLTGPLGVGKTTVADYLERAYGFVYFSISRIAVEKAEMYGIVERMGIIEFGKTLRNERGQDILARMTWEKICRKRENLYVVDGIRYPPEVEFFRHRSSYFTLLGIECPQPTRLQRAVKRLNSIDSSSSDYLRMCDEEETVGGLRDTLLMSDYNNRKRIIIGRRLGKRSGCDFRTRKHLILSITTQSHRSF